MTALDSSDAMWMQFALTEALKALELEEVPVGAIVVHDGKIVGRGHNRKETDKQACAHAEMIAIQEASQHLQRWRLSDCTVYVNLEPCAMCAGLMWQARVTRVVYGLADAKSGAFGSVFSVHSEAKLNHNISVTGGILEEESKAMLQKFFKKLRE